MNKFKLQFATVLLGTIPVATGLLGMLGVHDPVYVAAGRATNCPVGHQPSILFRRLGGRRSRPVVADPHDREANGPLSRPLGHDLHRRHRSSPVDDHAGMAARRLRRLYGDRNRRCAAVHLVAVPGGEVRK